MKFIFLFILSGCLSVEQHPIIVGKPLPEVYKNSAYIYDTTNGYIKYKYGGGWKDATKIVTTRNDTVLYIYGIWPQNIRNNNWRLKWNVRPGKNFKIQNFFGGSIGFCTINMIYF